MAFLVMSTRTSPLMVMSGALEPVIGLNRTTSKGLAAIETNCRAKHAISAAIFVYRDIGSRTAMSDSCNVLSAGTVNKSIAMFNP